MSREERQCISKIMNLLICTYKLTIIRNRIGKDDERSKTRAFTRSIASVLTNLDDWFSQF